MKCSNDYDKIRIKSNRKREIKAAGATYCDCPACTIVGEILEKKSLIL